MRHGKGLRKFGRNASHRRALLRSLATSFFKHESFETTVQKAKELRPIVEKLITSGKEDTVAHRRLAYSYLMNKAVVHKLFTDVAPRFVSRNGGYTRIVRTRIRHGDTAEMAVIELVEKKSAAPAATPPAKKAPAAKKPKAEKKAAAEPKAPAKKKKAAAA